MNKRMQIHNYFTLVATVPLMVLLSSKNIVLCRIRSQGSASVNMCTVASGRADAYWEFGIHAWDMAAGDLIVREAGGVVLSTDCTFI